MRYVTIGPVLLGLQRIIGYQRGALTLHCTITPKDYEISDFSGIAVRLGRKYTTCRVVCIGVRRKKVAHV